MRCLNCGQENKDTAKNCRKCGGDFTLAPAWFPDWRWHAKTLAIIYAGVIVFYYGVTFLLRRLPAPYQIRHIPIEMTPWLRHGQKFLPDDQLKPPPPWPAPVGNP
ncbi:MAG TPA: zinc ribbon domain-containing protein [Elusimicrobiota bacterium]|nr:zinc ribbon domain-containing protein [Elusimicrobiota bacterium]